MPTSKKRRRNSSGKGATARKRPSHASSSYGPGRRSESRTRPHWHRLAGIALAVTGLAVVVVNYLEHFNVGWMPGGHREAYFVLGLVVAAFGAWFLAVFDRPA